MSASRIDRASALPYYAQLKAILAADLEAERLLPGDRLPGEHELCELYGVSRTVVRQALGELEAEGRLRRHKGRGTFVASPKVAEAMTQHFSGLAEEVAARGGSLHNEVRRLEVGAAPPAVAGELEIEPGDDVVVLERLRIVDGRPWSLVTTWIPLPMGEGVTVDAPAQPVDTDYPAHAFNMQMLGSGIVFPHRGEAKPLVAEPNALARAEAFDGAENVAGAYGEYVNAFDWDSLADLFARDGWRELPFIGVLAGRDKILAGAKIRYGDRGTGPNPAFQPIHMLTQPVTTVSPDGSRVQLRARLLQFNSAANGPGSWIAGVYEDQLIKENGAWKIAGMDLDYTWMASYRDGWTKADPHAADALKPTVALLARYKLDAPIRGEPGIPFPAISSLPFHYANPVSGRAPERLIGWTEIEPKR